MSNVSKGRTFVYLADNKPSELHLISVPIELASHLQLTHSLGHDLGPSPNYRIRISDLQ